MAHAHTTNRRTFTSCRARSRLRYHPRRLHQMEQCVFDDCSWRLQGPADMTVNFLRHLYQGMGPGGRELVERTFDEIRRPPAG